MSWAEIPKKIKRVLEEVKADGRQGGLCVPVALDGLVGGQLPFEFYRRGVEGNITVGEIREKFHKAEGKEYSAYNLEPEQRNTHTTRLNLNRGARDIIRGLQEKKVTGVLLIEEQRRGETHCSSFMPGPGVSILKFDALSPKIVEPIRGPRAEKLIKKTWRQGIVLLLELPKTTEE